MTWAVNVLLVKSKSHSPAPSYNPLTSHQRVRRPMHMQTSEPRIDSDMRSEEELDPPFTIFIHNYVLTP
jgi:hypothetical protein